MKKKLSEKKINSYFFPSTHLVHADPDQLVAPGVHHVAPPVGVVENGQVGPVRVPRRLADAAGDPGHGSGVHDPYRLQLTAGVPPRVTQRPLAEVEKKDKNFLRGGAHFFPKKRGGRKKQNRYFFQEKKHSRRTVCRKFDGNSEPGRSSRTGCPGRTPTTILPLRPCSERGKKTGAGGKKMPSGKKMTKKERAAVGAVVCEKR